MPMPGIRGVVLGWAAADVVGTVVFSGAGVLHAASVIVATRVASVVRMGECYT